MTQIISTVAEWRKVRSLATFKNKQIGLIPTMGALHDGHESLLRRAREECDFVVTSIFVNPTQFNEPADLAKYPRTWEADLARINSLHVDFLFAPNYEEIYPDNYNYKVSERELSQMLCGAKRPGHFDGVLTVVLKLFNLVQPTHAYFGEKDYQQLTLLQEMSKALFLDIEIVRCPTIRQSDGLAMSSRNQRLSDSARRQAAFFPKILMSQKIPSEIIRDLESEGFKVDYVEDYKGRRYGAVFINDVRLIDNVKI